MKHSGKTYEMTTTKVFRYKRTFGGLKPITIREIRGVRITPYDKSYKRWIGESWYNDLNINCL